ncbi:alpha/beta hydrolase family protein [Sinimarinibacterium sp. CAU 1509]|uniref:alpha/beta hydrolase family protein n=1 Tax=Sinimarinibacterium sp. CAU 1509 TaxID=2562283 RepID=UPI00146AE5DE|nr:alpha/beta fold hydrolase [Sinimarinibacterium sp. CAU 1509]
MREIHLTLSAADAHPLAATLFEPSRPPQAAVLINSATGVPRGYYRAYAQFLAHRGFAVLCYDYRGIGNSRFHGARNEQLTMRNWGELDAAAAIDYLGTRYPRRSLLAIAHSVGGQLIGLAANNEQLDAVLCVAAQSGYWRHWPQRLQPVMAAIWHLLVPVAATLSDPLPQRLLGAELPRGIAREWARWCRHPEFIVDAQGRSLHAGFERYRGRMRFITISDDAFYAPPQAGQALARKYRNAQVELSQLTPAMLGVEAIGHFGYFRNGMAPAWQDSADWLRNAIPHSQHKAA